MSAHTPGPWVLDGEDINEHNNLVGVFVAKDGNGRVAKTFSNCLVVDNEECRANARLIAAAPELLAALKAIRDGGPEGGEDFFFWHEAYSPAIEKARAAIAKAEGKQ